MKDKCVRNVSIRGPGGSKSIKIDNNSPSIIAEMKEQAEKFFGVPAEEQLFIASGRGLEKKML